VLAVRSDPAPLFIFELRSQERVLAGSLQHEYKLGQSCIVMR